MSPLSAITAFFQAATQALKAFPLWLAWHLTKEMEALTFEILTHEDAATPADKRRADELRISLAYRRRLHAALFPAGITPESGNGDPNITRAIPVPD